MKAREFKNGTIKLSAENKADSEQLYMFLSGGKHSRPWFIERIGKVIVIDNEGSLVIRIMDELHADTLFSYWQNDLGYRFCDISEPCEMQK